MKKTILILFFLPLLLQAQKQSDWLTPYADARFENDKIIYSFCNSQELMITGIIPRYYSESLMKLRTDFSRPVPDIKDVTKQQLKIREYLTEESISNLSKEEEEEYLRLAAMVLIWDMQLDREVLATLKAIEQSGNREINQQAGLVLMLEEVYKGLR